MMSARGCVFGAALGSAFKAVLFFLNALIKGIVAVMTFFGLWAPFLYALAGVILYFVLDFNPFVFDIDGILYTAGFAASVVVSIIITVRHLLAKPLKSVRDGFKKPVWEKKDKKENKDAEEKEFAKRPSRAIERKRKNVSTEPRKHTGGKPNKSIAEKIIVSDEVPKVYYSKREANTVIHEYSDRFEVYRISGSREILDKVEFKNNEYLYR